MANIRKTKQGRWQVTVRKKGYPPKYKSFISKKNAHRWAKEIETLMEKKIFEDYEVLSHIKLKDLIRKFRDEVVINHKAYKQTKSKLNTLLKYKVSHHSISDLKVEHLKNFKLELKKIGKSPKTINIYLSLLRSVWKYAKIDLNLNLPLKDPFLYIRNEKVNNFRHQIYSKEQLQKLILCASHSKLNCLVDIIKFGYFTMARISEILNLKRKDVDFNKHLATFRNTKNGEDRTIPLSKEAELILKKYIFGESFFNIHYSKFQHYFEIARDNAGLTGYRFHDMRATGISRALLSGMSVAEVCVISGHKDWSQVKRYTRIQPADLINKVNSF